MGSAKKQNGGSSVQKKAAEMQAKAEISRMVKVQVDNEINIERKVTTKGSEQLDQNYFETYSRNRSGELLQGVKEIASFLDKTSGDYYILLGIPDTIK